MIVHTQVRETCESAAACCGHALGTHPPGQALVHLVIDVQVCSLTIEYRVVQYVPSISISKQFESILLTFLTRISILLLCRDGRQCKKLILWRVVESFCSPTHNIVPHISWHDPPCHRTRKKYADFLSMVIFQLLLQKFWIQTWFCNCQQSLLISHCL